jgi:hypothetical protein
MLAEMRNALGITDLLRLGAFQTHSRRGIRERHQSIDS